MLRMNIAFKVQRTLRRQCKLLHENALERNNSDCVERVLPFKLANHCFTCRWKRVRTACRNKEIYGLDFIVGTCLLCMPAEVDTAHHHQLSQRKYMLRRRLCIHKNVTANKSSSGRRQQQSFSRLIGWVQPNGMGFVLVAAALTRAANKNPVKRTKLTIICLGFIV